MRLPQENRTAWHGAACSLTRAPVVALTSFSARPSSSSPGATLGSASTRHTCTAPSLVSEVSLRLTAVRLGWWRRQASRSGSTPGVMGLSCKSRRCSEVPDSRPRASALPPAGPTREDASLKSYTGGARPSKQGQAGGREVRRSMPGPLGLESRELHARV